MPQSTAGITQFYGEEKTHVRIKATHVIALIIFIAILMILLHAFGGSIIAG